MSVFESMQGNLSDSARQHYITQAHIRETVLKNANYDLTAVAQILVSERHRKSDLVHLVEHLLVELEQSRAHISLYENMSHQERQKPVALAHIILQDDGLEARVDVLDGTHLQATDSPVPLYILPPAAVDEKKVADTSWPQSMPTQVSAWLKVCAEIDQIIGQYESMPRPEPEPIAEMASPVTAEQLALQAEYSKLQESLFVARSKAEKLVRPMYLALTVLKQSDVADERAQFEAWAATQWPADKLTRAPFPHEEEYNWASVGHAWGMWQHMKAYFQNNSRRQE